MADQLNREKSAFEIPKEFDKGVFAVGVDHKVDVIAERERKAKVRLTESDDEALLSRLERAGFSIVGRVGKRFTAEGEVEKTDLHGEHLRWEEHAGALFRAVLDVGGARLLWTCDPQLAKKHGFFNRRDARFVKWIEGNTVVPPRTSVYLPGVGGARVVRRIGDELVVARIIETDRPADEAAQLAAAGFSVKTEVVGPRTLVIGSLRIKA